MGVDPAVYGSWFQAVPLQKAVTNEAASSLVLTLNGKEQELADAARSLGLRSERPPDCLAYTAAGAVHAARGQLQKARQEFERAVQSRQAVPGIGPWPAIVAMEQLTQVLLDLGDRSDAAAADDRRDL